MKDARTSIVKLLRNMANEAAEVDAPHAADLRALSAELERGPVVVQTTVRTNGVAAELAMDAVGPVSLPRRVFVASPYAGDVARNERYARACMVDSLARGEAPFVPHLLYTQLLDGVEHKASPEAR